MPKRGLKLQQRRTQACEGPQSPLLGVALRAGDAPLAPRLAAGVADEGAEPLCEDVGHPQLWVHGALGQRLARDVHRVVWVEHGAAGPLRCRRRSRRATALARAAAGPPCAAGLARIGLRRPPPPLRRAPAALVGHVAHQRRVVPAVRSALVNDHCGQLVQEVRLPSLLRRALAAEEGPHVEQERERERVVDLDALEAAEVEAKAAVGGVKAAASEGGMKGQVGMRVRT